MSRLRTTALLAAVLTFAASSFAQVTDHRDIKTPALRQFSIPQPKRIALPNGMVVFLQEDHELPLIAGSATIRGGERDVPGAKAGLVDIYGQAWRTGGTTSKSGDQLDEFLEARAARVESGGDQDSTSVSMDVLKGDFDAVYPLFVDLLRNPAFRQEKIDLAKTQANTVISRRNDEPGEIIGRETLKLGYGADSPYARQIEYATIASITREDLLDFHKRTVHPNNIILSFIGDFDSAKMEKRIRETFGSWPRGPQIAKPALTSTPAKPGVYFIAKDDVTQANIAMVHPGIERNNPDYPAVAVMNEIFSGGFSGRLMQRLRSERGLTYGVGGGIGAGWDFPGLFRVQMATKSSTTHEALEALRGEVGKLISDPITPAEMSLAKESILNAFVFTMDTRAKALNQQVLLEFYGFPADYFTKYPAAIEKVTAEDVQNVAKKYVHPDRLAILLVGKEADFEKPLSSLGTVTPIDITIPELDAGKPASAGSNAEGVALANKVAQFVGGKAAIDSVKSLRRVATMTMNTPQGAMELGIDSLTQFPLSQRTVMKLPMGEMTRVVTPEAAFVITPAGTQDIPGSQRDAALSEMRAELLSALKAIDGGDYQFAATGKEKVGDVETTVVEVTNAGNTVKWLVEPSTGRLVRSIARAGAPTPGEVVTDFSEWKTFGGIQLPTVAIVTREGEKFAEVRLSNAEVNPAVDASAFKKP